MPRSRPSLVIGGCTCLAVRPHPTPLRPSTGIRLASLIERSPSGIGLVMLSGHACPIGGRPAGLPIGPRPTALRPPARRRVAATRIERPPSDAGLIIPPRHARPVRLSVRSQPASNRSPAWWRIDIDPKGGTASPLLAISRSGLVPRRQMAEQAFWRLDRQGGLSTNQCAQ